MNKSIITLFIFLCLLPIASATQIDIYYPNDNITTDIYYANGSEFYNVINNSINDSAFTCIILKDQIVTDDDLLDDPKIIYHKFLTVIWVIILVFIFIILAKVIKGVLR